jgi:NADPH-dependent 2,4-dienoyl-CoA reductase/sulfur reductase-like enzyme/nitrite reductase/ring-hydroxylating ferredoxin subunit
MDEAGWKRVARDADCAESVPLVVEEGMDKILLVRLKGKLYAVGHECPHYQEKLENGALFGTQVVCKSHFARIDVTTGRVVSPPALNDLPVYPVKVEAGEVLIGPAVKPKFPKPAAAIGSDPRVFLLIGAGAAGNTAAETLRRNGYAGRIVMLTEESERPYDRPNLSKDFITGKVGEDWLPLRGPKFYPAQSIELMTGKKVVSLDPGKKTARLADGQIISFDKALVATGGSPRRLPIPGGDGEGCFLLRTTADARVILTAALQSKRAAIIGAGFIGLELATSLRDRGLEVTVIAPEALPLARIFGDRIGAKIKAMHESRGVRMHLGAAPSGITGGMGAKVITAAGKKVEADFVIIGLGIQPRIDFLEGSGIEENGAVPVDERMQTRAPDIFAAGDIAALPDSDFGRRRVEHWVAAERHGQRAALCMLDGDPGPMEVDVFWSKQAGASLKYVGHAPEYDQVVYRGVVEEGKFLAGYYRGGVLKAAASIGMALDLVAIERLLRFKAPLAAAQFADQGFDLLSAAREVPASGR